MNTACCITLFSGRQTTGIASEFGPSSIVKTSPLGSVPLDPKLAGALQDENATTSNGSVALYFCPVLIISRCNLASNHLSTSTWAATEGRFWQRVIIT